MKLNIAIGIVVGLVGHHFGLGIIAGIVLTLAICVIVDEVRQ